MAMILASRWQERRQSDKEEVELSQPSSVTSIQLQDLRNEMMDVINAVVQEQVQAAEEKFENRLESLQIELQQTQELLEQQQETTKRLLSSQSTTFQQLQQKLSQAAASQAHALEVLSLDLNQQVQTQLVAAKQELINTQQELSAAQQELSVAQQELMDSHKVLSTAQQELTTAQQDFKAAAEQGLQKADQELKLIQQELKLTQQAVIVRAQNSHCVSPWDLLHPIPASSTSGRSPPEWFPSNLKQFMSLSQRQVEELLEVYGLATDGGEQNNYLKLKTFLGLP